MKQLYILFFVLASLSTKAQVPAYNFINANSIKTGMHSNGSLFFNELRNNAGFWVPYISAGGPQLATAFSGGIWLSADDENGNIYISKMTYGSIWTNSDYIPGSVNVDESKKDYNQVWKVTKSEIESLIIDFQDGVIDEEVSQNILDWPGSDPDLPNQKLAPFFDQNQDGIYDPYNGDFPNIEINGQDCSPEEMIYTIYHDDQEARTLALGVEVHVLLYGFKSEQDKVLDRTLFTRVKVVNKSPNIYRNFRLGFWQDPDLGCFTDDFMGCDVNRNSAFVYNRDEIDGTTGSSCEAGVNTYASSPPVMNYTFLNQDLKSFMVYLNPNIGNPPFATTDPNVYKEYYNYMNSLWKDGTPLTLGKNGYDLNSTDYTEYAFDGDPNDLSQWSMTSLNPPLYEQRFVATVGADVFESSFTVDIGCIFSQVPGQNHLENFKTSQGDVDYIQDFYNRKLVSTDVEELSNKNLLVYPNPSKGVFNVKDYEMYNQFIVTDQLGRMVVRNGLNHPQIQLNLKAGIYILSLKEKNTSSIQHVKIVIVD